MLRSETGRWFMFSSPCFHRTGSPASLHSFPTRRSSDLFADDFPILGILQLHARRLRQLGRGLGQLDRKSTRLNSSHRCISYAVFCLKKKMNGIEAARKLNATGSSVRVVFLTVQAAPDYV